ncbi:hypothetical protein C8R45DRAFT_1104769 [Mycena sanguinolenta]|nr:hypothetical protein C8R45DRAFT_1104769 [Mycena sanguinolenta]
MSFLLPVNVTAVVLARGDTDPAAAGREQRQTRLDLCVRDGVLADEYETIKRSPLLSNSIRRPLPDFGFGFAYDEPRSHAAAEGMGAVGHCREPEFKLQYDSLDFLRTAISLVDITVVCKYRFLPTRLPLHRPGIRTLNSLNLYQTSKRFVSAARLTLMQSGRSPGNPLLSCIYDGCM